MKLPKHILSPILKFNEIYGIDLTSAEQGSPEWQMAKLGVISASNADAVLAGGKTATRSTYMAELVAQIATSVFQEISAAPLDWGKQHEDAARAAYEFSSGLTMTPTAFAFKDETFRVGCSPDGMVTETKGAEIKCPWNTKNYIEFLCSDKIKPEWHKQCNFTMWAMKLNQWDFVQFDPRMKRNPLHKITIERDEALSKTLDDAVPQFIADMDKMLEKAGFVFGEQWIRLGLKKVEVKGA